MHIDWNNEFWYFTESTNGPQLGRQEAQEPNKTLIPELPSTPVLCLMTWSQWSKRLLLGLATAGDSVQDSQHDWGKANIVIIPCCLGAIINRNPFLGVYAISYTSNLGDGGYMVTMAVGESRISAPEQADPSSMIRPVPFYVRLGLLWLRSKTSNTKTCQGHFGISEEITMNIIMVITSIGWDIIPLNHGYISS